MDRLGIELLAIEARSLARLTRAKLAMAEERGELTDMLTTIAATAASVSATIEADLLAPAIAADSRPTQVA